MKVKKVCFILCFLLCFSVCLCGCQPTLPQPDNEISIEKALTCTYEKEKIVSFLDTPEPCTLKELHQQFPVELIRQMDRENEKTIYYTVYQTSEGGRFFLVFSSLDRRESFHEDMMLGAVLYSEKALSLDQWNQIEEGDTWQDVLQINPDTYYNASQNSVYHTTYHLLESNFFGSVTFKDGAVVCEDWRSEKRVTSMYILPQDMP